MRPWLVHAIDQSWSHPTLPLYTSHSHWPLVSTNICELLRPAFHSPCTYSPGSCIPPPNVQHLLDLISCTAIAPCQRIVGHLSNQMPSAGWLLCSHNVVFTWLTFSLEVSEVGNFTYLHRTLNNMDTNKRMEFWVMIAMISCSTANSVVLSGTKKVLNYLPCCKPIYGLIT